MPPIARSFPLLAILVLAFAILFAVSPLFSDGFNGFTPQQFPVVQDFWPVQPASYAFSIWGLIYAWLIAGSAWGLWRAPQDADWQRMRGPLAISLGIGMFWIAAANAAPVLATVMIVVMAAAAVAAYLRAGHGDTIWQLRPVGLYAGWLTAAAGVAIGVVLGGYGLLPPQAAALILLVAVLIVALAVQTARPGEWSYPAAVIWALAGVVVANWSPGNWAVIAVALAGIIAMAFRHVTRPEVAT